MANDKYEVEVTPLFIANLVKDRYPDKVFNILQKDENTIIVTFVNERGQHEYMRLSSQTCDFKKTKTDFIFPKDADPFKILKEIDSVLSLTATERAWQYITRNFYVNINDIYLTLQGDSIDCFKVDNKIYVMTKTKEKIAKIVVEKGLYKVIPCKESFDRKENVIRYINGLLTLLEEN